MTANENLCKRCLQDLSQKKEIKSHERISFLIEESGAIHNYLKSLNDETMIDLPLYEKLVSITKILFDTSELIEQYKKIKAK